MLPLLLKEHQTGMRQFDALLEKINPGLLLNIMLFYIRHPKILFYFEV